MSNDGMHSEHNRDAEAFASARKYLIWSQVLSIVSLFLISVVFSAVAIALAVTGYRRLAALAEGKGGQPEARKAVVRPGIIAIVIAVSALTVNVIALIALYPLIMQIIQDGSLSSILGVTQANAPAPQTTPGAALFG